MECCEHHDKLDNRISTMELKLEELHKDIREIKAALIGDLQNPGWITKLTNEDKSNQSRIEQLECKVAKFEQVFNKILWKVLGALTLAAIAGGGVMSTIERIF
jgi:uncharacterized coiled-coil protein SlyX